MAARKYASCCAVPNPMVAFKGYHDIMHDITRVSIHAKAVQMSSLKQVRIV